jgi:hypothetical protein
MKRPKRQRPHCCIEGCDNSAALDRLICETCKSRAWRARNPIGALFANLKVSAGKREISFELTLAEFTEFCIATDYHKKHGKDPDSLTVDRIRPWEGYHARNIRALSHQKNSARRSDPPTCADLRQAFKTG